MTFYQGVMVRGDTLDGRWVFIDWLYPGQNKLTAIKDVKAIERLIREQGFLGWYATSERDHTTMHKILAKMNATKYQEDEHNYYFRKDVR